MSPTILQCNEYLFKASNNLYHYALTKSRGVDAEHRAAFAAGYVFGRMQALAQAWPQCGFPPALQEAFAVGMSRGLETYTLPTWVTPAIPHVEVIDG